jgi:hypothetical protein
LCYSCGFTKQIDIERRIYEVQKLRKKIQAKRKGHHDHGKAKRDTKRARTWKNSKRRKVNIPNIERASEKEREGRRREEKEEERREEGEW